MADEETEPVETDETEEVEGAKPEAKLGDAGKRALDAERAARKAAEKERDANAAKLKEIEDRDKSEAEKAAERLAEAEKRAVEVEARATRAEVSASSGVPVDILCGPESADAEKVEAFAKRAIEWALDVTKKGSRGPIIPTQGTQPDKSVKASADDWFRDAINSN